MLQNERKRGQGLINRANDCFLNVILQMITHTAPLARYLMERHKTDCEYYGSFRWTAIEDWLYLFLLVILVDSATHHAANEASPRYLV